MRYRKLLILVPGVLVTLPLAACGTERASDQAGSKSPGAGAGGGTVSPAPATRLEISVKASEKAQAKTMTLTCDPAGGTLPDADKACAALEKAKADWFAPVPKNSVCTEIYGGPEQASVKGVWEGKQIGATFKRSNGCDLAKWNAVGALFGEVPPVR